MVETYQKTNKLITTMHSHEISTLKTSIFLFIALATLLQKHVTSQIPTKPTYFNRNCYASYAGNYTKNSTYYQNLKLVLSDLVTQASTAHFFNSSVGIPTAYAQYYCRGDISSQLCQDCVKAAVQVPQEGGDCFPVTGGAVWYQECTLQYDNKSNVGFWDQAFTFPAWWKSLVNVSDSTKFEQVFSGLIDQLIKKAAYGGDPEEFATGEGIVTQYETVYCLVQCSPDITGSTCGDCLRGGLRYLANKFFGNDPEWVFLFYPKCQMRYSLSPFYPISAPPPATPHIPPPPPGKDGKHDLTRIVAPVAAGSIFLLCGIAFGMWFCFYKTKRSPPNSSPVQVQRPRDVHQEDSEIGNIECFGFRAIENATLNFSPTNKLGEGGFGSVYKGILSKGQLVAIKRLSINSVQGIREFKTEVAVVAKLQHRNLVRLVGYCVENEERVLVYEYLSNLSLDKILFDASKSSMLDWRRRYNIIEGIASGLRYLHIDSLLTIVHRDLKSSNILLDNEMKPKIADFGLAKLVNIDETSTGNTSRIAGTYGYMAPEYAMAGRFSIKSDIYSFGVIILEILSGKSISHFYDPSNGDGLLHHAWGIWNERAIQRLVDPTLQHNYSKAEAERCLQIALLCIQDDSTTRPTIRIVVGMLENQSLELPHPSAPPSFFRSPSTSILGSNTQSGQTTQHSQVGFHDSTSGGYFDNLHPR